MLNVTVLILLFTSLKGVCMSEVVGSKGKTTKTTATVTPTATATDSSTSTQTTAIKVVHAESTMKRSPKKSKYRDLLESIPVAKISDGKISGQALIITQKQIVSIRQSAKSMGYGVKTSKINKDNCGSLPAEEIGKFFLWKIKLEDVQVRQVRKNKK
jgi:hypothetical protein